MIIIKKKKLLTVLLIGSLALLCFASGAIASSHLTKITAHLNSAISVELKGKPLNLSQSQPITYNNTTYLPLRTIAEATGLDVKWNAENQRVSLNEKIPSTPGERKTFSKNDIDIIKGHTTELILKPQDITYTNKRYDEVIKVDSVGYITRHVFLTFPEGTKRVGVTFGSEGRDNKYEINYKIYDIDDNVVSLGTLNPNAATYVEFELSDAGTELKFTFESPAS